jgi:transposase
MSIENVQEYGSVVAQHSVWETLGISEIIDRIGLRVGGNVPLSKLVEIQTIHRNCDPGSREAAERWYPKTALPIILKVPISQIYSRILLRSLDYLQPKYTVPMQIEIYKKITDAYGIEPTRVDIDLTSVHFEGDNCILAMFGYNPPGQGGRKQIVVSIAVDQHGIPLTHIVFPGNRVSMKSLKRMDHTLREGFDVEGAVRVGDRGFATEENIQYMDRKKEPYLLALELNNKEKGIANEAIQKDNWIKADDKVHITEVLRHENGRDKKYLACINSEKAENEKTARENRLKAAEEELARHQRAIAQGKVKSRKDRDKRIGNILQSNSVRSYIDYQGNKNGYGFRFWRLTDKIKKAERWNGVFVLVTTETYMTSLEMLGSYRERDRVEKAIRVLKDILEIEPQYVYTKEHVLGHVFICVLAYQIRSVMKYMLKQDSVDMSIDEAFEVLERLKVTNISVEGNDAKVYRKLTRQDGKIAKLVETFNMRDGDMFLAP